MNRIALTFLVCCALLSDLSATDFKPDSVRIIDIDEIVVTASPKEHRLLRELPGASTILTQKDMQNSQVTGLKSLSTLVPNIFIPDYGSRLTSAIYIRGIGSRINTPAVGLYVDNVPYLDKSAFDFNYTDIEKIEVLRGPQGTLYGRNTMGGLIRLYTKSPLTYQGTDVNIGAATNGDAQASLTHYKKVSKSFAFSAGGFYNFENGFFKNDYLNQPIDRSHNAGGRLRTMWIPKDNLKMDLNINYDFNKQGGYPYIYMGKVNSKSPTRPDLEDKITQNEESLYKRHLFNASLNLESTHEKFILTSVTGFQCLDDHMAIDQDFTKDNIFTLEQKQRQESLTEELTLKSNGTNRKWDWVTGLSAYYQWQNMDAPVTFKEDGMKMITNFIPESIRDKFNIKILELYIPGKFKTPLAGVALFHQSTINHLGIEGLSATVGVRLDYEHNSLNYDTHTEMGCQANINGNEQVMNMPPKEFKGNLKNDYFHILPKLAIKYDFDHQNNIYASVSEGIRSGGYNVQMFSDLLQGELRKGMGPTSNASVEDVIVYKPEYAWNYEIGTHLTLWRHRLFLDVAAFYINTRNQQIAKFAENGLGRITTNAGKSKSTGMEAALRAIFTQSFNMNVTYGFTHATFTNYETSEKLNGMTTKVNYKGNFVPFVPMHTLNIGAEYTFFMRPTKWLERIRLNANYHGAGRIYWTENNSASQRFYGTLDGRLSLEKGRGSISLWIRNALNGEYQAFYFESMGNKFMQRNNPLQAGVDIKCRF